MALILDPTAAPPEGSPAGADGDLIKDSDTASFVADVIEMSMKVPVVVDFWAPWCGPCKTLGPLIEKMVRNAGGLVRLVKINVDENRELAMQMNVQSIPSVFGFVQGRPVDGFTGAVQESQIKGFIDRLTGGAKAPLDEALEAGKQALEDGDAATASSRFAEVLAQDPVHPGAIAGMIRCFVATGEAGHAQEVIGRLPPELLKNAEIAAAISAMELAEQGGGSVDTADFEEKLARDADDHQARFELAIALYGAGRSEEAIENLIEIVRRDREWNEEAARKQLIKIFDALGPTHELTVQGRRQLSTVLFS